MEDDLKFSSNGALNRSLLYRSFNDINFYVEDEDSEYMYETIFKRLFNGKYKIAAIFPSNGKEGIKKAFREFGESDSNTGAENMYILDGDFDLYIRQSEMIDNIHVIYLKSYNIENYLIDENAVLIFAKGKLKMMDDEIKQKIQFSFWKNEIVSQAKKLFLLYCAIQKNGLQIENVSRNAYEFIDGKTGFERNGAYKKYYDDVIEKEPNIDKDILLIQSEYEAKYGGEYFNFICGKFLFISLFAYLRGIIKENFRKDDLKWWLIQNFDITKLDFIKNTVDEISTAKERDTFITADSSTL